MALSTEEDFIAFGRHLQDVRATLANDCVTCSYEPAIYTHVEEALGAIDTAIGMTAIRLGRLIVEKKGQQ